jgi:hypothetical protein
VLRASNLRFAKGTCERRIRFRRRPVPPGANFRDRRHLDAVTPQFEVACGYGR